MKEKFKELFILIEMDIIYNWLRIPFVRRYYDKKEERIKERIINNSTKLMEKLKDEGIQIEEESKRQEFYTHTNLKNYLN